MKGRAGRGAYVGLVMEIEIYRRFKDGTCRAYRHGHRAL